MSGFSKTIVAVALLCAAAGCSEGTTFERSCNGEAVPNCLPHEYSIIENVSVTPGEVMVGDPRPELRFQIDLSRCPQAAVFHEVAVSMLVGGAGDAGASVFDVVRLADDGVTEGDETAGDGRIDVTLNNPFLGDRIPDNTDVTLRFRSRARADCSSGRCIGGTCTSEEVTLPFRLGARVMREQ